MTKPSFENHITVNNKKYTYSLKKIDTEHVFLECKAANIAQEFLREDIPDLLIDLPNLILSEQEYKTSRGEIIRFRLKSEDKKAILLKAQKKGYKTVSAFLRDLAMQQG